jgi:Matrixin
MKTLALCLLIAAAQSAAALTIRIDYTYDTNNFFNTQVKKDAIEAVAKFYGDLIKDNLLRIDPADFDRATWEARPTHPATGLPISIPGLIVPENTIIVYVGSRVLGSQTLGVGGPGGLSAGGFKPWFDRLAGRGSAGALLIAPAKKTDHCPWGGSIAFDSASTWNFSQSQNLAGYEFISIALHEMGHVLGIGIVESWLNKASAGFFTGPACIRSYGATPPLQSGDSHFATTTNNSPTFGSFSKAHGTISPVAMLAALTEDRSTFVVATDLDLAALVDCGWEISPPLGLTTTALNPSAAGFTWKSSSFLDYTVQRSADLLTFSDPSGLVAGNGKVQTWSDTSLLPDKGFYRLRSTRPAVFPVAPSLAAAARTAPPTETYRTFTVAPVSVSCCAAKMDALPKER